MKHDRQAFNRKRLRRLELLEPRVLMAGVVISEFLAINDKNIVDEDNTHSDWVELHNTDPAPVSLNGFFLTDDDADLDKWQFPAGVTIPADGYVRVFASGKDRKVVGQNLHTNFQLNGEDGEFLGLVAPNGTTVVHSYAPFPPQFEDVSYGIGTTTPPGTITDNLVDEEAPLKAFVPADNTLGTTWRNASFIDSSWTLTGTSGVGYDTVTASGTDYTPYINLNIQPNLFNQSPRVGCYMRFTFPVADPSLYNTMLLRMRYDDGFVAFLNGTEIARSSNFGGTPTWNSTAPSLPSDAAAISYVNYDVTAFRSALVAGNNNVLAIHGLNSGPSSNDFLIDPLLTANRTPPSVPGLTGYMTTPTPGAVNNPATLGLVSDTHFSEHRGFKTGPIDVTITNDTPGAQIRYTLDGSAPTATTGTVYTGTPVHITSTTILRAAAFKTDWTPSNIDSQSYIYLNQVINQNGSGLPAYANWGHDKGDPDTTGAPTQNEADWTMDPNIVGPDPNGMVNNLKTVPTVSLSMPWSNWFGTGGQGIYISGSNSERAASMEMFNPDSSSVFQADGGVEIFGGSSTDRWKTDKLSMRVTFKEPYDTTKLDASIFTNNPGLNQNVTTTFDTLILDAQINFAWTYAGAGGVGPLGSEFLQRGKAKFIQDQYTADLQNLTGGHAPHGRIVNLYINGLYWGIYMLHERPDEHFGAEYYGNDSDQYDVLKHTSTTVVNDDGAIPSSATTNYNSMLAAINSPAADLSNVEQWLDVDDFINYMLVNYYVGNADWSQHNWYATFWRGDGVNPGHGVWRYHSWDAEHVLRDLNEDLTGKNDTGAHGPTEVHQKLIALSSEYRVRFNDQVQKLFFNGGVLTPENAAAVYQTRMNEAYDVMAAESARWGDNANKPTYTPFTRDDWLATQNDLINNYFPFRTGVVVNQFASRGWLLPLTAPSLSQYGGSIPNGYQLTMSAPAGSIYYTTDGTDPRLTGGGLNTGHAVPYGGAVTLNSATRVIARAYDGVNWSAAIDVTFITSVGFPVRVSELHYNPAARAGVTDKEDMEFIELVNTSASQTVSLAGMQLTQFSSTPYVFDSGLSLGPGQRIVVARNVAVFQQVYGIGVNVAPTGYGTANLSNSGERVTLLGPVGETVQDFTYSDSAPWTSAPDGGGPSLEMIDPTADPSVAANWRASVFVGGSPGSGGDTVSSAFAVSPAQTYTVQFSRDMNGTSFDAADLSVQKSGGPVLHPTSVTYSAGTRTATFTFATPIADGNYTATLGAGSVIDSSGGALGPAALALSPFFVLAGDVNHDAVVDVNDLNILAVNWMQSGRTFAQGNVDYSPDGLVNESDLGIISLNWLKTPATGGGGGGLTGAPLPVIDGITQQPIKNPPPRQPRAPQRQPAQRVIDSIEQTTATAVTG